MMLVDLWRRYAWLLVALAAAATLAPVRVAMSVAAVDPTRTPGAMAILETSALAGPLLAIIASVSGLLLGAGVWYADQTAGHVYSLTLPIPRWHYALLRYASGAILLSVIIIAFWIGALAASSLVLLPVGILAYPTALSVRFALTAFLMFSLFYALSSLTKRSAAVVLGLLALFVIVEIALDAAGADRSLVEWLFLEREADWLLPAGRWMLFDV